MFLSGAMPKVQSLEVQYGPLENSTYAPPVKRDGAAAAASVVVLDGQEAGTKRRRPLPPIPRQVRPALTRMPTFHREHTPTEPGLVSDSNEDREVIDIFEMLSSEPSSNGESSDEPTNRHVFGTLAVGGNDDRRMAQMAISSYCCPMPIASMTRGLNAGEDESPGATPLVESADHPPLEIFSPRLPAGPAILALPESRPISPFALSPFHLAAATGQTPSEYPPIGTSFLYMPPSDSGDQLPISEFGSFVGPGSRSSICLSIGQSSSSCSSRFLSVDERDLEAECNISMSEMIGSSMSRMSRMSDVSTGLPIPLPLDLPEFVDAFRSHERLLSDPVAGSGLPKALARVESEMTEAKPSWCDPFDQGFVHVDGMPEIALPQPLCAEDPAPFEMEPRRLLPRASIATDTMHAPEVGAWWKASAVQSEIGRRRSVMDVQSVLQRVCEV